jgi:uncharacterized membrane protein YgcG
MGQTAVSEVSILEALVPASIRLQNDNVATVRVCLAAAAGELLTLMVALQSRVHEEATSAAYYDSSSERSNVDAESIGKQYKKQVDDRLIPLVQVLLNDADPEVTSAALRAVTNASRKSMTATTSRHRMNTMQSEDDGSSVASLHSHTSRDTTTRQQAPVFLPVLSENQVLRLLPTLSELADSKQWRVRQSAVEIVPALLGCTHQQETRTQISKLCIRLMEDTVDAVRRTAAECLCMGGSSLGSHGDDASLEWICTIVLPCIQHCAQHEKSKQRMLSLKMIESVLSDVSWQSTKNLLSSPSSRPSSSNPNGSSSGGGGSVSTTTTAMDTTTTSQSMTSGTAVKELASVALSLTHDRIANVRLNVGRVLLEVLHVLEEEDIQFIMNVLQEQLHSEPDRGNDRDVLYFGKRCIQRAEFLLEERQREGGSGGGGGGGSITS